MRLIYDQLSPRLLAKNSANLMSDSLMRLRHRQSIPVYYFSSTKNVGDLIGPYLVHKISGREVYRARTTEFPNLMSVGSILAKASHRSFIWGSGFMEDLKTDLRLDPEKVFAVRGTHSLNKLREYFGMKFELPLGDPALLMPQFFHPQGIEKKYKLGIIPHYADFDDLKKITLDHNEGIAILDVRQDPESFIEEMLMCETIASSSLHGLILADAYDIPNRWIEMSNNVSGERWKFKDYYSITEKQTIEPFDLRRDGISDWLQSLQRENFQVSKTTQDLDDLISCFPSSAFGS